MKSLVYSEIESVSRQAGALLKDRFGRQLKVSVKKDRSLVTEADLASEALILGHLRAKFPEDHILSEEGGGGTVPGRWRPGEFVWVVDPLDGTTNFANKYPFFSVSIGRCLVATDGRLAPQAGAVLDPILDRFYYAELGCGAYLNGSLITVGKPRPLADSYLVTGFYYQKDEALAVEIRRFGRVAARCQSIRRDGSAALDLALVAEGVFDAFWENGLQPWDVAAGALLVTEAGGFVRNYGSRAVQSPYDMMQPGLIAGYRDVADELTDLIGDP